MNLPHSLEAEKALLGAVFLDPRCLGLISLDPSDFFDARNRLVYTGMRELEAAGKPVDVTLLESQLGERFAAVGFDGISDIISSNCTADNAEHYEGVILERSRQREIMRAASEILSRGSSPDDSYLDWASELISSVALRGKGKGGLREAKVIGKETFNELFEGADGSKTKVASGFDDVDAILGGGFKRGTLSLLAARPGNGKTSLAMNMAVNAAVAGHPCAVFSLEMSARELFLRAMSAEARVDTRDLQQGVANRTDISNLSVATSRLMELPIEIDDTPAISVTELRVRARRWAVKHLGKLGWVMVDYLQLMRAGNGKDTREQEVGAISRALKALSKELDCPVLAMAQLNRKLEERADKKPVLSDLRESGSLEQDADVVMFIHRADGSEEADLIVSKHRSGPTGELKLSFEPRFTRFGNRKTNYGF